MPEHPLNPAQPGARPKLIERIETAGWQFDFFQAVWLLERYLTPRSVVGHSGPACDEAIRFRPHLSMGFPPTDVRSISPATDDSGDLQFYRIDSTFLGLYGVSTPLPLDFGVRVLRTVQRHETASGQVEPEAQAPSTRDSYTGASPLRDFLDLIHHRLFSLFYRTWTKYRYDLAFGIEGRDSITAYLLWLIGCDPNSRRDEVGVHPLRLIRYAGLLTQHPRSAVSLQGMLEDYWGNISVEVEQFLDRWVAVPTDAMNSIGRRNAVLGDDLTIGDVIFDMAGGYRVRIGPVDWATYLRFLPDGADFHQTHSLTKICSQDRLAMSMTVKLRAGEIPELRLASDSRASRLGYTSWVRTHHMPETSVTFNAEN